MDGISTIFLSFTIQNVTIVLIDSGTEQDHMKKKKFDAGTKIDAGWA